jgi:hypothetical protein
LSDEDLALYTRKYTHKEGSQKDLNKQVSNKPFTHIFASLSFVLLFYLNPGHRSSKANANLCSVQSSQWKHQEGKFRRHPHISGRTFQISSRKVHRKAFRSGISDVSLFHMKIAAFRKTFDTAKEQVPNLATLLEQGKAQVNTPAVVMA